MKIAVQVIFSVLCVMAWYYSDGQTEVAFFGSLIQAIGSGKEAKKLQAKANAINPVRPDYEIQQEAKDYLANAQNMAQGDVPGYGRSINQNQGATANAVGQAKQFADSGASLLSTLGIVTEGERNNMNDINVQNQGFKVGQMNNFNSALMNMSGLKDQQFNLNEYQPWQQEEFDKRNFEQAAIKQRNDTRDAWSAFGDGIVNTGLSIFGAPMGAGGGSLFGKVFGGKNQVRTSETPMNAPERPNPFAPNPFIRNPFGS